MQKSIPLGAVGYKNVMKCIPKLDLQQSEPKVASECENSSQNEFNSDAKLGFFSRFFGSRALRAPKGVPGGSQELPRHPPEAKMNKKRYFFDGFLVHL